MIYCCEKCGFRFSRSGEVEVCPNCDSLRIRFADKNEKAKYEKKLEQQPEKN